MHCCGLGKIFFFYLFFLDIFLFGSPDNRGLEMEIKTFDEMLLK